MKRFWDKVQCGAPDECWPWVSSARTENGYGVAWADFGNGARTTTAHRVAFFLDRGRPPTSGLDVMHSCDNRLCCNPAHLREGSRLENMQDCAQKGRTRKSATVFCEGHHKTKLTNVQVQTIRTRGKDGERPTAIAAAFGVSNAVVWDILKGKTWRAIL